MRVIKLVLMLVFLAAHVVLAQDHPAVEVVLSQSTATQGDTIRADIIVRKGSNIGGIDIGVQVDERCLRILDRQPGGYLPTTETEGAFSAFSELNEHSTRLAAALTDRAKYVSGDGVFYFLQLEVLCAQGAAPVNLSYAQVSSYVDPSAEIIDVVSYDLDKGTLSASNAQIEIVQAAQTTAAPTITAPPVQPEQVTAVATSAVEATTVTSQPVSSTQDQTLLMAAISLMVIGFLGLLILIVFERRRRARRP